MSESLDTFEGETGMPTESHQPWRATSAWAWGKRGTGRAAQDKRRGREERTGLSNAELAKEEGTIIASSPSFAEEDMENSHPPCKAASFSSPALANAKRSKATSASPSARATPPSPFADDDKENGVERKRESKRRRTQLQTSDAMALDPLTLNPISSNSSNGTESDFDFDDDDDDPYKLRNNFSHPGDVALRGLGTKWGEPTYSELKSNHIIFNPRSAHRADLSLPFTHNLETTRDARSLIYWRKGKPEKVGHTRDINRRCAAYKADDKLTIVADLDSIPLRVDQKLQHSLRELFKEIDEHPDIPQYYKDLWKVFRGDAMRLGLKTRLVVSLGEIGCQKAWKLPCRAEAFQAVGCKQVDEWRALIDSAVKKIRKVLDDVKKRNGMKPKAASPMMMSSWKPGRQEFHEDRDPSKPMSSKITLTEACVGQNNWEDALPFAAKRDPKTQEDTYSIAYTPEEKEDGKKRIEQWIETISKSGEFGLLDTNSTIFGNESALAAFLEGLEYKSHGSYMEGDLTLWVRKPKDSNTMASVILACKPFCQAAHYDPKFQRDLSVRIRRNLAAEVARQVCWYVRDLDLAKTKTVTSTTEYPGLVAACACAVLIEGFHLGGKGLLIVNAIVRDIWSPPEHNACLHNGLKKLRDIPGQHPQDFAPFSRRAKRELKQMLEVGGDAKGKPDRRYRQRVRCRLSWANVTNATKEELASLFDDIDKIVGSDYQIVGWSKARRWREVLSELDKEGPFSFLFKMRKAKMQRERIDWNDRYGKLVSRHVGTRTSVQCTSHHQQVSEAGNPVPVAQKCTVKGCSKLRQSGCNGMCKAHSREAGNPVPRPDAQTCTVKGCSKWRTSGCNGMCTSHSREAGNPVPRPDAQTCTVKGCSKGRQSGCNGMCIAHSREAGNPVTRSVAQTCTVKGCSKRKQSGCNGMCKAHSTEAGNPVPVAQKCTVKGCSKRWQSGCNGMCIAHSREAGNPVPVAQICTVKGCSKRWQSGCNGMCIAHSREAGNPVTRSVAQKCTVKGCSKR